MADPFRTSRSTLGDTTVVRKGSKYDKDSDAYAKKFPISKYPDTERSNADDNMATDLKAATETMKERGNTAGGPDLYDRLSARNTRERTKYAKGGKVK